MIKCPFCGFDNEDGALFCEQCKSDLSAVPVPVAEAAPVEAMPVEAMPVEAVAEAVAVAEETVPMAAVVDSGPAPEALAAVAEVVEAAPAPEPPAPEAPAPEPAPASEAVPAAAAAAAAAVAALAAPAQTGTSVPPGAAPKLVVIRGQKLNMEFPIYPDLNFIGRADDKPVDIDLEDQEPPDRVWTSRQHAVLHYDDAQAIITVEDLNSSNGTFVNRARVHPGQKKQIFVNDVIQVGTVHLKLKA